MPRIICSLFVMFALLFAGIDQPVVAQNQVQTSSLLADVQIVATERFSRQRATERGRGTIVLIDNQVVIITSGHSVEANEDDGRISDVKIIFQNQEFTATSWQSHLGQERDVGLVFLSEIDQNTLRPHAVTMSSEIGNTGITYTNGRATVCTNVTQRNGMVLRDPEDRRQPTTQVAMTAMCTSEAVRSGQSGSGLFNQDGQLVGVFFADISGQRGFNAAFSLAQI